VKISLQCRVTDCLAYLRDKVLKACWLQRSRFEVARGRRHRGHEAADILLITFYPHIPPSRGLKM